ncbi:DUF4031 domain-containing protein [Roseibium sediminicola]|uniref:DUF4031 domain-containing protein n=1 Tax=Roseibium sediminicola TaxID=2933272 RepID=A0ABT0H0H6_9HYPH|nr:DUF4031 domain-containing protein [Roseibium sp. CAU 1639]MCK7615200.1 DUF4031 domain-containing protein [Roseibium sp. CAU 1639]
MTVYVDDMEAGFGRMVMCHMWADTLPELLEMADRIGVARKWLQQPPKASWVHFDIAKSKRALAVAAGAVQTDRFGPVEHCARLLVASGDPVKVERGQKQLAAVASCRARRAEVRLI